MTIAIIASILGAVCLALMVVTDRIMVGDCYQGKSNHAWFVSSVAGSLFGLLLTCLVWAGSVMVGVVDNFNTLVLLALELFIWKGIATFVVGLVGIQILLHYFRCFEEEAHATAVASWLAATPVFVLIGMHVFSFFIPIENSEDLPKNFMWLIGVILATAGLVLFERISGGPRGNSNIYRKELVKLLLMSVLYTVALKHIFAINLDANDNTLEAIALMPFYWIGFASGARIMLKRGEWTSFRNDWNGHIRYYLVPILIVEIIGMLVFFFEYVSLTNLDPTFVSIIMGTHIFLVYIFDIALGLLRKSMEQRSVTKLSFVGITLISKKLPVSRLELRYISREILAVMIATCGITLVIVYGGL